jgi:hypothetical protein
LQAGATPIDSGDPPPDRPSEHRDFGILALCRPGIKRDELLHGASMFGGILSRRCPPSPGLDLLRELTGRIPMSSDW